MTRRLLIRLMEKEAYSFINRWTAGTDRWKKRRIHRYSGIMPTRCRLGANLRCTRDHLSFSRMCVSGSGP